MGVVAVAEAATELAEQVPRLEPGPHDIPEAMELQVLMAPAAEEAEEEPVLPETEEQLQEQQPGLVHPKTEAMEEQAEPPQTVLGIMEIITVELVVVAMHNLADRKELAVPAQAVMWLLPGLSHTILRIPVILQCCPTGIQARQEEVLHRQISRAITRLSLCKAGMI
jgi:hypothetical protein